MAVLEIVKAGDPVLKQIAAPIEKVDSKLRKLMDMHGGSQNVWISNVPNFEYAFWDTNMVDSRGWDLSIIGEIHDITFSELCRTFAHSRQDYAKLDAIYNRCSDMETVREFNSQMWNGKESHSADFYVPKDSSLCRVIEVWTKERKPKYRLQDIGLLRQSEL